MTAVLRIFIGLSLLAGCEQFDPLRMRPSKDKSKKKTHHEINGKFGYFYNEEKDVCENKGGVTGYNRDYLGECGSIIDKDLSGQDLTGKNLRGIHLDSVNLSNADLSGASLMGCELDSVKFNNAKLVGVDFRLSTIQYSNFDGADISSASFYKKNTEGKNIYSNLTGTTFEGTIFDGGTIIYKTLKELEDAGAIMKGSDESMEKFMTRLGEVPANIEVATTGPEAFSEYEYALLTDDFAQIQNLKLNESADDASIESEWFEQIFKSRDMSGVVPFLAERIKYLTRDKAYFSDNIASNYSSNWYSKAWNIRSLQENGKVFTYSLNDFKINGRTVPIDLPRMGIIRINNMYFELWRFTRELRIGTLLHEARHSDVESFPPDEVIRANMKSTAKTEEELKYFHRHTQCPAGHDLAGDNACDLHAWGAYSVDLIFNAHVANSCENCSESQIQAALIEAIDMKSRVLIYDAMKRGEHDSKLNLNSITTNP